MSESGIQPNRPTEHKLKLDSQLRTIFTKKKKANILRTAELIDIFLHIDY